MSEFVECDRSQGSTLNPVAVGFLTRKIVQLKMPKIGCLSENIEFSVEKGESILAAVLRANISQVKLAAELRVALPVW